MNRNKCILCESDKCRIIEDPDDFLSISCQRGYNLSVSTEIYNLPDETFNKVACIIFERILNRQDNLSSGIHYYFDESANSQPTSTKLVNIAPYLSTYPDSIIERAERSLLNFSKMYPSFGSLIGLESLDIRAAYCSYFDYSSEFYGVINLMIELKYLVKPNQDSSAYIISAKGWLKIEELRKKSVELKQAFVAMSFKSDANYIRESLKAAIMSCGYLPVLIDEKEHNNQIVPEIFYEINRSKFIVVDVTYPNDGAYYEAGYAQGLGKQVIVCCNKSTFHGDSTTTRKPHFDISQKSMVLWENEQDLIERLTTRIRSTIL